VSAARTASSNENARSGARPKLFLPFLSQYSATGVSQPVALVKDSRRLARHSAIWADSSCVFSAALTGRDIAAVSATIAAAAHIILLKEFERIRSLCMRAVLHNMGSCNLTLPASEPG
jgi:hypothetical protein